MTPHDHPAYTTPAESASAAASAPLSRGDVTELLHVREPIGQVVEDMAVEQIRDVHGVPSGPQVGCERLDSVGATEDVVDEEHVSDGEHLRNERPRNHLPTGSAAHPGRPTGLGAPIQR